MTELGTALRDLADRRQPAGGVDPGELWTRGRQRVRRRRLVGAAVAALVVAAVGMSALLVPAPTVVMPAGEPHAPGIPRDIYTPNQHLAGTAEKGPLGQLAVIAGAQRDKGLGLFGISAQTGEYRFLDLPDAADGPSVALSPNGSYLAYWFGPVQAHPVGDLGKQPVRGVAIYNTRTGSVEKAPISGTGGVVPGGLTWLDDYTVSYASAPGGSMIWHFGRQPHPAAVPVPAAGVQRNRDGSLLLPTSAVAYARYSTDPNGKFYNVPNGVRLPDPATPQTPVGATSYSAISISGPLVLVVPAVAGALAHPLMVGSLPLHRISNGRPDLRLNKVPSLSLVGQLQETLFLGWRDDHTALVAASGRGSGPELFEADLRARTVRRVGVADPQNYQPLLTVASDLVSQPLVAGRRPPEPQVPVAWLALGGLLAVAGGLWFVRRRPGA